jgi:hypothetical protein
VVFRTNRWVLLAAGGVGVVLAIAGCSGDAEVYIAEGTTDARSLSSASNFVYKCLKDKGWDVELTWDGGIEVTSETVPEAQLDLYTSDSDECWGAINDRIVSMQPDEISKVYQAELATRECLIERGVDVGTPPSEQQFIDTFQTQRWSAYGDSTAMATTAGEDEWQAMNEACPQPAWSLGAQ